jgi:hypothetical protein
VVRSFVNFFKSLGPFIEIAFLAYIIGGIAGSSATAVVTFVFLAVTIFMFSFVLPVAWGVTFCLYVASMSNLLYGIIVGVVVGLIRLWIKKR